MVYNYKKQRSPIVPMYTILGTTDGVLEKNGGETRAAKQQIRKIEDTPGPDMYHLGWTIGSQNSTLRTAPKFTFGARLSSWRGGGMPGPVYNLRLSYRPWDNAPTMTRRISLPDSNGFPGPHYSLGHSEEDPEELEKGRETLDTKGKEPKVLDENSGQSDNEDSEPDDYRITEDQQWALQELENLKKEMDYPDKDPPKYNVKERLKELNQELANDPTPVENNREPKVLFKANIVDLVAPAPEYIDDESESKSLDNIQPKMDDKENSGKKAEKNKSEKSCSNQVLIEQSGTFELVNADDVTAQDMGLPTASGEKAKKNSKNKNQKVPRPPSKPRPATAAESSRRNVRSQTSQRRPLSAQSHDSSLLENYNSPYGLTPEQKQLAKQRAEALEKKKKEDERKKKEEEEEKQKESMEAFQYWLQKKKEQDKKKKEEEEKLRKQIQRKTRVS